MSLTADDERDGISPSSNELRFSRRRLAGMRRSAFRWNSCEADILVMVSADPNRSRLDRSPPSEAFRQDKTDPAWIGPVSVWFEPQIAIPDHRRTPVEDISRNELHLGIGQSGRLSEAAEIEPEKQRRGPVGTDLGRSDNRMIVGDTID